MEGAGNGISAAGTDAPPVVTVTRALADRIAVVAQLLKSDEMPDEALRRLTDLGVELVPGCTAAAVPVAAGSQALTFAASDPRIDELHRQFDGDPGPGLERWLDNEHSP